MLCHYLDYHDVFSCITCLPTDRELPRPYEMSAQLRSGNFAMTVLQLYEYSILEVMQTQLDGKIVYLSF